MARLITTPEEFEQSFSTAFEAISELGRGYTALGRPGVAVRLFQKTLEVENAPVKARLGLLIEFGRTLITNLFVNHDGEELLDATLAEARQLAKSSGDKQALADVLSLLGETDYFVTIFDGFIVDGERQKFGPTLEYQRQALALREELGDSRGICESKFFIGLVNERWQQPESAEVEYRQVLDMAEQGGYFYERAEACRHLAGLALGKGELDAALEFGKQALASRQAAHFKPFQPLDHLLLSDIYLKRNEPDAAEKHALAAQALGNEMDYSGVKVLAMLRLADVALARGERDEARRGYEKALGLAQELGQTLLLNFTKQRLAQLN